MKFLFVVALMPLLGTSKTCLSDSRKNAASRAATGISENCDCTCLALYYADHCENIITDPCLSDPCLNGGKCTALDANIHCECLEGFGGAFCQNIDTGSEVEKTTVTDGIVATTLQDPCLNDPCKNGGSCVATGISENFECTCLAGYYGEHCENIITDPCLSDPCKNGGKCAATGISGNFDCTCLTGYYGELCENKITDSCLIDPCLNGGKGTAMDEHIHCECLEGYGGAFCENIDTGSEVKETTVTDGIAATTLPDPCLSDPCKNGGSCTVTDISGIFECTCLAGYYGERCENKIADPCLSDPCKNGASCEATGISGNFDCTCLTGYYGELCENKITEPCLSDPCLNGGKCITVEEYIHCECQEGYGGDFCQNIDTGSEIEETTVTDRILATTPHDPCLSDPCKNGALCAATGISGKFECICLTGYYGERCENKITETCLSDSRKNGASRVVTGISENCDCTCLARYYADHCENIITDPCLSDPCKNGGKCTAIDTHIHCTCLEGFGGALCENTATCPEKVFSSYAINVQQNSTCGGNNIIDVNEPVYFTFPMATYGEGYSKSLEECNNDCANLGLQPLAVAECQSNGEYAVPIEFDCSINPAELPPGEQQLNYALVATTTSSDMTTDTVDFALSATLNFTTTAITVDDTEGNNVMSINNNVFVGASQLSDTDISNILTSVQHLGNKVDVTAATIARSTLKSYTNVQSRMALAVAEGISTGTYDLDTYFTLILPDEPNLLYAGVKLQSDQPTSSYISATPNVNAGRVSFAMYSSYKDLFKNLDGLAVQNTVLSAFGDASLFNFRFKRTGDLKNNLECVRYVSGVWKGENDCNVVYNGDYATCSCPTAGEYLMKSIVIAKEDPGLSAGAIAGIVIGCLAGVGLIGGAVYYFAFYKKKDKASSISPYDEEEMKGRANVAADLDNEDD